MCSRERGWEIQGFHGTLPEVTVGLGFQVRSKKQFSVSVALRRFQGRSRGFQRVLDSHKLVPEEIKAKGFRILPEYQGYLRGIQGCFKWSHGASEMFERVSERPFKIGGLT